MGQMGQMGQMNQMAQPQRQLQTSGRRGDKVYSYVFAMLRHANCTATDAFLCCR